MQTQIRRNRTWRLIRVQFIRFRNSIRLKGVVSHLSFSTELRCTRCLVRRSSGSYVLNRPCVPVEGGEEILSNILGIDAIKLFFVVSEKERLKPGTSACFLLLLPMKYSANFHIKPNTFNTFIFFVNVSKKTVKQ